MYVCALNVLAQHMITRGMVLLNEISKTVNLFNYSFNNLFCIPIFPNIEYVIIRNLVLLMDELSVLQ